MRGAALLTILAVLGCGGIVLSVPPFEPDDPPPDLRPHLIPPPPGVPWPESFRQGAPHAPPGPAQTTGTVELLVLLIDFDDVVHDLGHTPAFFDDFYNNPSDGSRSFREYYSDTSRGLLTVQTTVHPAWLQSAQPMREYGEDGSNPPDDENGKIYRLVTETVQLADSAVDFSEFDADQDGVVDHLNVVHAGAGQENTADPDNQLIWSHRWAVLDADPTFPGDQALVADGVQIFGYTMVSEDSPVGVAAHEFGHDLGLPDLYDTDGSSEGAGIWDIMAGGTWTGNPAGTSPAHFGAWSKVSLGWVLPTDVTTARVGEPIEAVETSGTVLRLRITGGSSTEYFLVENRQPIGFDGALPGSGLLIWHIDDSLTSNHIDSHRKVDLEEADEAVSGDQPTGPDDPWRSTAAGWGPETTPDSRSYSGSETGWRVRDVSVSGATMTATIARDITRDLAVSAIRLPFTAAPETPVSAAIDVRNDGAQASDVTLDARLYLDSVQPSALVDQEAFTRSGLAAQTTATFSLDFTPATPGRYIVLASLRDAADEIPTNDERASHILVNTFLFRDDVESGANGWVSNAASTDTHQWTIVNDTDPDGAAHSRTHSWRFGFEPTLLSLFPPERYTLTSRRIDLTPGPTFLLFYHRYDLTGRTVPVLPIGTNDTDDGIVEVSYDDGASWTPMARYTGGDMTWRGVSFDLTSNLTGPTVLRVRFNVSADVMKNSGGWWIDDVMLAERGLARAVVVLGSAGPHEGPAGGVARFTVKVANVGDYETDFRLDRILPGGWDASVIGGGTGPLRGHRVRIAPDNDVAVRIAVAIPANATAGALTEVTVTATAVEEAGVSASLTVRVRTAGFPIETLLTYGLLAVAVAIVVAAAVVGLRRRRRRPRT